MTRTKPLELAVLAVARAIKVAKLGKALRDLPEGTQEPLYNLGSLGAVRDVFRDEL